MAEISVVIPVYNVEKYLHECLESVRVQSFTDWEAICVNDGSSDSSLTIVKEFAEKDPRFRIMDQANAGQASARNTGVRAATGKYIYFLDSDDLITPDALQWMYDTAKAHGSEILHCAWQPFYEEGVPHDPYTDQDFFKSGEQTTPVNGAELFIKTARCNDWNVLVWSRFYNAGFYMSKGLSFHEGVIHEDESFALIADLLAEKAVRFNKCCYHRRVRLGSTMTTGMAAARHLTGYLTAYDDIAAFLETHHYSAEADDLLQRRLACLLISAKKYLPDQPDAGLLQRIADAERFIADAEAADERANRSFADRLLAPIRCLRENGLRYTLGRIFGKKS